ncbi:TniQ family protein [Streptomyces sp. NPDC001975]
MAPPRGRRPCSTPFHRALPQQVRFINAESAGSYMHRLASANGLEFAKLLDLVGRGRKALPAPGSAELYFNSTALSRLSILTGCSPARLQQALPAARAEHLLPSTRNTPAWRWLLQGSQQQHLVRACSLCAAARGATQTVYVWSDLPWQVCLRHGTWQDNQPGRDARGLPAKATTWLLQAHRRRLAFEQRLGQMGRPLFADAYMTLMTWNQQGWILSEWLVRRQSLEGIDSTGPVLSSMVTYPEAVELAKMFGRYERQRLTGTLKEHEWWWQLAYTMVRWGAPTGWPVRTGTDTEEAREPIAAWIAQHNPSPRPRRKLYKPAQTLAHGRWTMLHRHRRPWPRTPHEITDRLLPLERVSCLCLPGTTAEASTQQADRTDAARTASSANTLPRATSPAYRTGATSQRAEEEPTDTEEHWTRG